MMSYPQGYPHDRAAMERAPGQSFTDKKHTKTTTQVVFVREDSQVDLATRTGKVSFKYFSQIPTPN